MSWNIWRNFTVRVSVSGTVSVPIVLNWRPLPFCTGTVSDGTASLATAWSRKRRAAVSGSRSLSLSAPAGRSPGDAARSASSGAIAPDDDSSAVCREKAFSPRAASIAIVVYLPVKLSEVRRNRPRPGAARAADGAIPETNRGGGTSFLGVFADEDAAGRRQRSTFAGQGEE